MNILCHGLTMVIVIHVIVHYGLTDVDGVLVVVHTFT